VRALSNMFRRDLKAGNLSANRMLTSAD
jgi:hypothetical protein